MEMNLKDTLLSRKKAVIAASCLVLIVAGSAIFFGFSAKKPVPEQPPRVRVRRRCPETVRELVLSV